MKCLFIGDVVGRSGRYAVSKFLSKNKYDFVCGNIENSAAGFGITNRVYKEFVRYGFNAMTSGNHVWDKKDIIEHISSWDRFIRPANLKDTTYGDGFKVFNIKGINIAVVNLIGNVFIDIPSFNPFTSFDNIYKQLPQNTFIIVDFHGEATSEKLAFGYYADGRANVIIGSHTHTQTNDLRILPNKSLYLTDAGMCGSIDSILGMTKDPIIDRFVTGNKSRFTVETKGDSLFNAVEFSFNSDMAVNEYSLIYKVYSAKSSN